MNGIKRPKFPPDGARNTRSSKMTLPIVILSRPQLGENIGASARAMKNFGLEEMRLVAPRAGWPNPKAVAMAVGAADLVEAAGLFADTKAALGDLNYVLATTARPRGVPKEILTPIEAARRLRIAAARGEKCGILFGNERAGLDNDEVSFCDAVVTIPTTGFSSLNLGQAVLLICYEWFRAEDRTPPAKCEHPPVQRRPTREEMFGLFEHLERELTVSGFLFPPDKREHMVRAIRATLNRAHLTYQEVQTLRGMIVALARGKHRVRKAEGSPGGD
jgi:tRNA/rRNA methyltransferase